MSRLPTNLRMILALPIVLLLSNCASVSEVNTESIGANPTDVSPEAATLYYLLLAEIAGRDDNLPLAVESLGKVANTTDDLVIIERATRVAIYAKEYEQAAKLSDRWLELAPDSPAALQVAAALALQLEQEAKAISIMRKVLVMNAPAYAATFSKIANTMAQQEWQQPGVALNIIAALAADYPDNAHAWFAYGYIALALGEFSLAEAKLAQAIALQPDFTQAIVYYARALLAQNNLNGLKVLAAAVQDYPKDMDLRLEYGQVLIDNRQALLAKEQFTQLYAAMPENTGFLYTLALLNIEVGELNTAEQQLQQLLKQDFKTDAAYYFLADIAKQKQQWELALERYQQIEINTEYWPDSQSQIAELLLKQQGLTTALAYLKQQQQLTDPQSKERIYLYLLQATLEEQAGLAAEAVLTLSTALEEAPNQAEVLYSRGFLYYGMGKFDLMETDFRTVLAIQPDHVDTLNTYGYILTDELERQQEAYPLIKTALELQPNDPAILDSMGWVLFKLGDTTAALPYLQRALALSTDPIIADHLIAVLVTLAENTAATAVLQQSLGKFPEDKNLQKWIPLLLTD